MIRSLLLVLFALAAALAQAQTEVRVVSPPGEINLPFWIAQDLGYFDESDLQVSIVHSEDGAARLTEVYEKRQHIAIVSLDELVAFNAAIANVPHASRSVAFLALAGIMFRPVASPATRTLAELTGRRIGIDAKDSPQSDLWQSVLRVSGVPKDAYEFVVLPGEAERLSALQSGRVDAVLLTPAAAARAAASGMRVFELQKVGPTIEHVATLNWNWRDRDEAVREFAVACVRAMEWLFEPANRAPAAALLRKYVPGLDAAQAASAIEIMTSRHYGFSPGCVLDQMLTLMTLERAEWRAGLPVSADPRKPRTPSDKDPIQWGAAQNARLAALANVANSQTDEPSMLAKPLLNVLEGHGDVGKAERALERALRSRKQLSDGTWLLEAMFEGYRTNVGWIAKSQSVEQRLAAWRAAYPESTHARLAEAWYWTSEAWRARGNAAAAQVPKAAWERFESRLAKARSVLEAIGPKAADNPVWHWAMLHVAFAQGASRQERAALFAEAVRREPSFLAHYTEFARGLTPRWGGSLKEYHAFADAMVARTKATEGKSMYARLYPLLTWVEHESDPFEDLGIPWPNLRTGFEDLLARHPNAKKTLHQYALYACRAEDGKTYRALHPKLERSAFPVNGAYTFEHCNETLLQRS